MREQLKLKVACFAMDDEAQPQRRLDQMFAAQASASPVAPAIYFRDQTHSYEYLMAASQSLARAMIGFGVGPGVLVAIGLTRSPLLLAVVLGVLEAGGAYLPLDRRYPPDRIRFVLEDSRAPILIVDNDWPPLPPFAGTVLELVDGELVQRVYQPAGTSNLPPDLAYVIYTSGSTGTPKGVMLGHGAVHLIDWAKEAFSQEDRSRVAATTSLCFDPSIFEIFVPLCTGGAVVLKENALEPFGAGELPTMLDSVPSVLAELCRARSIPASVRVLNVGGEPLPLELAQAAYGAHPNIRLLNHYGPTEATTCVTVGEVPRELLGAPSLGRAVRGAQVRVLDEHRQLAADGQIGEIHIGGPGLALGYLGREDLTAKRFIVEHGKRLYRTGDLGFWRDGELHFAGRADRQVKVRGFRVELGEVEAALKRIPTVNAAVVGIRNLSGSAQLIAWIEVEQPLAEAEVRAALEKWLPGYMMPSRIVSLSKFPLQASGKVDHGALVFPLPAPPGGDGGSVSAAERPIIHVFEEVLDREGIGPEDSFFDLGGDSLASVRVALRLEEVLGREIPAALIHQAPSARSLAGALDQFVFRPLTHLSVLRAGTDPSAAPLFCVADLFGHAFNYLSLAKRLGSNRTVYGLAPGPLQDLFTRDRDLDAIAGTFVDEIQRVCPQGPYLIAGYSSGGVIAAAVAGRLQAVQSSVRLILLDAYLHSRRPSLRWTLRWVKDRLRSLRRQASGAHNIQATLGFLVRLFQTWAKLTPRPPAWVPASQVAYASSLIKAGLAYVPQKFHGEALVVHASEADPSDSLFGGDEMLGWSQILAGPVAFELVVGDHHAFLREPAVGQTAMLVERFLATAQTDAHE